MEGNQHVGEKEKDTRIRERLPLLTQWWWRENAENDGRTQRGKDRQHTHIHRGWDIWIVLHELVQKDVTTLLKV